MSGLYHDFIAAKESEINEYLNTPNVSIRDFKKNKSYIHIHDDFIQILLNKQYLSSVPCYDYKNKELITGLCSIGCTVFHVDQLRFLYEKIELFEKEIDIAPETIAGMKIFKKTKDEVLQIINIFKEFILTAEKKDLCIYHFGI